MGAYHYDYAKKLIELGWVPVPTLDNTKVTPVKRWPELMNRYDKSVLGMFRKFASPGIAVILGDAADIDIEFKALDFIEQLRPKHTWLKDCPVISTPKGCSILVNSPDFAGKVRQFKDKDGRLVFEIRSGLRYRLIHGATPNGKYEFISRDVVKEGVTPTSLPYVSGEAVLSFLADLADMALIDLQNDPVQTEAVKRPSGKDAHGTSETWIDSLIRDEDLFVNVFSKYASSFVSVPGKAFACPFHGDTHPSASWYIRPDGAIIFCDFHMKGEDDKLTYDIIDCYAAFKTGSLKRISEPQERMLWAAKLAYEFNALPDKAARAAGMIDSYIGFIKRLTLKAKDRDTLLAVLDFMRYRCIAQTFVNVDVFGDSVRYLAQALNIDKAKINRAINFFCVLGMFEKSPVPSSRQDKRPDRLKLRITTYSAVASMFDKLVKAGLEYLRDLNQNLVYQILGITRTAAIFRRQTDKWEAKGWLPNWLASYLSKRPAHTPLEIYMKPWFEDQTKMYDSILAIFESQAAMSTPMLC